MSSEIDRAKRWKKRAGQTFAVACLTALSFWVVGVALEQVAVRLDANVAKARILARVEGESYDLLFLGDSTTLDGVSPPDVDAVAGTHSFNLATGGQSLLASQAVLRDHIARNAVPQWVVLGLFVNRRADEGLISGDLYYSLESGAREWYRNASSELEGSSRGAGFYLFNRLRAYRYRQATGSLLKWLARGDSPPLAFERGHLVLDYSAPAELGPPHEAGINEAAFASLLKYCRDQGIAVAIFEPPNHPGYSELSIGREATLIAMRKIASRYGVEFRSFNDEESLNYGTEEWLGSNHLNRRGAARFSRGQLGPFVAELFGRK